MYFSFIFGLIIKTMTLNEYFHEYGRPGLVSLAQKTGTKLSYLLQLNYVTEKRPSLDLAQRLIDASGGKLTLEGLSNPKKVLIRATRH